MGLHKKMTNNPNGRPVGSKNERTKQWEMLSQDFTGRHTERFNKILDNLPDEDFAKAYILILGYFKPKLAASKIEVGQRLTMQEQKVMISKMFDEIPD